MRKKHYHLLNHLLCNQTPTENPIAAEEWVVFSAIYQRSSYGVSPLLCHASIYRNRTHTRDTKVTFRWDISRSVWWTVTCHSLENHEINWRVLSLFWLDVWKYLGLCTVSQFWVIIYKWTYRYEHQLHYQHHLSTYFCFFVLCYNNLHKKAFMRGGE